MLTWIQLLIVAANAAWLVPRGLALLESDQLLSGHAAMSGFSEGWQPFLLDMTMGGTLLTSVQRAWIVLWTSLVRTPGSASTASLIFTFFWVPFALAVSARWFVKAWLGERASIPAGILTAVGFPLWMSFAGTDFYFLHLLGGFWILALKARLDHPLRELGRPWQWWAVGLAQGLLVYNFRASLLYWAVFWTPWTLLPKFLLTLARSPWIVDRVFRSAIAFLLVLTAYLHLRDSTLLVWAGKKITLHPGPNLRVCATVAGAWILCHLLPKARKRDWAALSLVSLGTLAGFLPEWIFLWTHPSLSPTVHQAPIQIDLQAILSALRQLLLGDSRWQLQGDSGLLLNSGPVLLSVVGGLLLVRRSLNSPRLWALLFLFFLNLAAFTFIHGTTPGAPRYLFSIYPVLLLVLALGVEKAGSLSVKGSVLTTSWVCAAFLAQRAHWIGTVAPHERLEQIQAIASEILLRGRSVLVSDAYEESIRYAMAADRRFEATQASWPDAPLGTKARAKIATEIAYLTEETLPARAADSHRSLLGVRRILSRPRAFGALTLYDARREAEDAGIRGASPLGDPAPATPLSSTASASGAQVSDRARYPREHD